MDDNDLGFVQDPHDVGFQPDQEEQPGYVESGVRGAVQGATFGGSDEIVGGLRGAYGKLTGEEGSLGDLYRKYQQMEEAKNEAAKTANPKTYLGGEITGGLASGIATGGLGIEGAAAEGLGSIGLEQAAKAGVGALAKEAAKKTLAAGAEGAVVGALQGGLSSKGSLLDNPSQVGKDVLSGTQSGAEFGGAVGAIGSTLGGALEYGKNALAGTDSNLGRQFARSIEQGKAGEILGENEPSKQAFAQKKSGFVDDITNKFVDAENSLGEEMKGTLDAASQQGATVPINDALNGSVDRFIAYQKIRPDYLADPEYQNLAQRIVDLRASRLAPKEAYALRKDLLNYADKVDNQDLKAIASQFSSGVMDSLDKSVPGFKEKMQNWKALREAGRETLQTRGQNPDFKQGWIGDLKEGQLRTADDVRNLLDNLQRPGYSSVEQARTLQYLGDNLKAVEKTHPGTIKRLGYETVDDFMQNIKDKADDLAIGHSILGTGSEKSSGLDALINTAWKALTLGSSPTARGTLFSVGQKVGKYGPKVQNLFRLPTAGHQAIADSLINSESTMAQQIGQNLKQAVDTGNMGQKNAALFVIQQNPKLRQVINGESDEP